MHTFLMNSISFLRLDVGIQGLPQPQTNELGLSSFGNDQMCMKQMLLHYMGDPLAWNW